MFRLGKTNKKANEPKSVAAKVKEDVVPKVNEAVHHAVEKTAPARSEAKARTAAAWQALRGDYPQPAPEKKRRGKVTAVVVGTAGAVAAVGAATWAAAKRMRTPEWVTSPEDSEAPGKSETKPAMKAKTRPAADDQAGASPDEVLADMAESSYDGAEATPR